MYQGFNANRNKSEWKKKKLILIIMQKSVRLGIYDLSAFENEHLKLGNSWEQSCFSQRCILPLAWAMMSSYLLSNSLLKYSLSYPTEM